MKWDFKIVVLLVEWSSFRGGLKAGFYCNGKILCAQLLALDCLIFYPFCDKFQVQWALANKSSCFL